MVRHELCSRIIYKGYEHNTSSVSPGCTPGEFHILFFENTLITDYTVFLDTGIFFVNGLLFQKYCSC